MAQYLEQNLIHSVDFAALHAASDRKIDIAKAARASFKLIQGGKNNGNTTEQMMGKEPLE